MSNESNKRKEYIKAIYSVRWESRPVSNTIFRDYDKRLCKIINDIGERRDSRKILDVGVGTGFPKANYFAEKGYNIYGVDIAKTLIHHCKRFYPKIKVCVGDAENLPFKDGIFDIVFCYRSLHFLPHIELALDEMIRVTKTYGYLFFEFLNLTPSVKRSPPKYLPTPNRIIAMAKIILKRDITAWRYKFIPIKTPINVRRIYKHLDTKSDIDFQVLSISELMAGLKFEKAKDYYPNEERIIIRVHKVK